MRYERTVWNDEKNKTAKSFSLAYNKSTLVVPTESR